MLTELLEPLKGLLENVTAGTIGLLIIVLGLLVPVVRAAVGELRGER